MYVVDDAGRGRFLSLAEGGDAEALDGLRGRLPFWPDRAAILRIIPAPSEASLQILRRSCRCSKSSRLKGRAHVGHVWIVVESVC
jgi:hypothetical protein